MNLVTSIDLHGFKSIKDLNNLSLGPLNVLIGANGAGKSNFISFFRMLNWMTFSPRFQEYIARVGGANALLHDGAEITSQIQASLTIKTLSGTNDYAIRLFHAAPDKLVFAEEKLRFSQGMVPNPKWTSLGSVHDETNLFSYADAGDTTAKTAKTILELLRRCVVYQFHNTSETARIKQRWVVDDNLKLREDGANLASFLYRLRETKPKYYRRIVSNIHQIAPFFVDFELEPYQGSILLQWRERNTDLIFGAHQASDGTLRLMALVTLLLQPQDELPNLIILDEPELGLHPYAISIIAGLIQSVAIHTQVIVATQSTTLVDYFKPEHIIVVDRNNRESSFRRLDLEQLRDWLAEYSLSELWEKNVIGGRPA